jgi:hypothetical protein
VFWYEYSSTCEVDKATPPSPFHPQYVAADDTCVVLEAGRQLKYLLIYKCWVLRVVVWEKACTCRGEMYENTDIEKKLPLFVIGK